MKLIQCRFSSGQRVPLLVQDGLATPLPKLVPFIYVQLKLRHRAYNTAAAHLRAIQAFYTYAKSRELDIDEAILACHFEAILALLDGYALWLQIRPNHIRYRSLTDSQLQIIRTLISPGAAENPFPERLQLRNWLMIELLLETGIRRGELLKLYTTDINLGTQHAYVSINDREHDPGDPRAEEPALKTHGRTVGISAQLYEVYEHYIQGERRPLRDGKRMKLRYRYLFISDRGRPLSIRALSNVLDRLFLTIELAHPGLLPTLSAHDFRHTFADRFLAYLIEQRGHDLERATDELRRVCGWSETSAMPRRYASRYLAESANRHNAQRASAAWGRLDS